ncbi:MAG: DUF948 domain-containing protein [Gaiellales bacterium]|nr:MAG: DUF948 domain-containing protein [Gaiellales bacterium]
MDWTAILQASLSFFLVLTALALAYLLVRIGGTFSRINDFLKRLDDEVIPLLSKTQVTLDEVNSQLGKVDDMLGTLVNVTNKVETTSRVMQSVVTRPVKKAAGLSAGVSEAVSHLISGQRGR